MKMNSPILSKSTRSLADERDDRVRALFAKLLAAENLSVQFSARARTASFYPRSRVLVLPRWKTDNEDVYTMLVAHEVGHALFTPRTTYSQFHSTVQRIATKAGHPKLLGWAKAAFNITEDVRIERLIQAKFPGLRRVFHSAYTSLLTSEAFAPGLRDVAAAGSAVNFLDRLNLHAKFRVAVPAPKIPFNDVESAFVARSLTTETAEEAADLAAEVMAFAIAAMKPQKDALPEPKEEEEESPVGSIGEDAEGERPEADGEVDEIGGEDEQLDSEPQAAAADEDESDDDDADDESDDDGNTVASDEEPGEGDVTDGIEVDPDDAANAIPEENVADLDREDEMAALSEEMLESDSESQNTDEAAESYDVGRGSRTIAIPSSNLSQVVIPYSTFIGDFWGSVETERKNKSKDAEQFDQFAASVNEHVADIATTIGPMVSKFLANAAASVDRRTSSHLSGCLDCTKLAFTRTSEDIFTRITTVRDGINHGLHIMLDWSGSMQHQLLFYIDQVVAFALFCRKVGVPFELVAFSDNRNLLSNVYAAEMWNGTPPTSSKARLIQMLTSRMSDTDFRRAVITMYGIGVAMHPSGSVRLRIGWENRSRFAKTAKAHQRFTSITHPLALDRADARFLLRLVDTKYYLNGTPLSVSLLHACDNACRFAAANRVDRLHFITMTDGEGDDSGWSGQSMFFQDDLAEFGDAAMQEPDSGKFDCTMTKNGHSVKGSSQENVAELVKKCLPANSSTTLISLGTHLGCGSRWINDEVQGKILIHNAHLVVPVVAEQIRKDVDRGRGAIGYRANSYRFYGLPDEPSHVHVAGLSFTDNFMILNGSMQLSLGAWRGRKKDGTFEEHALLRKRSATLMNALGGLIA